MTGNLILLAHGSPDPRHADAVDAIANRVHRALGSTWTVSTSYLQHHGPTTTEVFTTVRRADTRQVMVQPLLLTAGEHWRYDVPGITAEAISNPAVQLLDPPDPVDLLAAALEVLTPVRDNVPFGGSVTAAEPTGNTVMSSWPPMPVHSVVLVAGGSRIQDLRKHFEPLATEVERILGPSLPNQGDTQARSIPVDLLTRPSEILKLPSSGPTTWIVPLLVSRGRLYDSMVNAADQMGAKVTRPVGETTSFASELAARARTARARTARARDGNGYS